ncbi:MAG: hypothetical protein HRU17_21065 [Polyangiaceae bacterium]|nr:hypothetical protein [Polyangiaceae bacterium]
MTRIAGYRFGPRMFTIGALTLGSFLLGVCGACSNVPELASLPLSEEEFSREWASEYCSTRESCDCSVATGSSCESRTLDEVRSGSSEATTAGLYYNAECAHRALRQLATAGCASSGELTAANCEICAVYHGDGLEGDACEVVAVAVLGVVSDCGSDLSCVESVCTASCRSAAELPFPEAGSCADAGCAADGGTDGGADGGAEEAAVCK